MQRKFKNNTDVYLLNFLQQIAKFMFLTLSCSIYLRLSEGFSNSFDFSLQKESGKKPLSFCVLFRICIYKLCFKF